MVCYTALADRSMIEAASLIPGLTENPQPSVVQPTAGGSMCLSGAACCGAGIGRKWVTVPVPASKELPMSHRDAYTSGGCV